ncbi:hypothetical protein BDN72DRAFT_777348 [Pluteus cervinus]|uniref:Uncharacterized protein n=1 Tax=Pluteus cervinus TaxID=181527 RepID=A0ACD3A994_9AGAR|nr:hypothetical protein BDN72DRAFT_777348 [Pluteus cervinus]
MPWFEAEQRAESLVDPSCLKTRETLSVFAIDPTASKKWLLQSIARPPRFPTSEWTKVLRGEFIDIDAIFSSLHNIAPVKEGSASVGSNEIKFKTTQPARKVETFGEWLSAWTLIEKAVTFAFPHREQELTDYREYICGEFAAKRVQSHKRIIFFNAAIRAVVQGGQSKLLTDRYSFSSEYSAIVLPDGVAYNSKPLKTPSRTSSGPNSSTGICNRYNSERGCSNSSCIYRHVCRKCLRTGHGKEKCSVKENSGAGSSA